jgi:phage gp36-like protein
VPGILREISVSLTVYELWRRRASEQMPKSVVDERKDAIRLLEHIADNRIALFETDKATTYLTNKRPSDQIFPASVLDTM